jgi:hypothetical protein
MTNASIQPEREFGYSDAETNCECNPWPPKQVAEGSSGYHRDDRKGDLSHAKSRRISVCDLIKFLTAHTGPSLREDIKLGNKELLAASTQFY